jgi:hypothetical protein
VAEGVGSDDGNSAMMSSGDISEGSEEGGDVGNSVSNRRGDISDNGINGFGLQVMAAMAGDG